MRVMRKLLLLACLCVGCGSQGGGGGSTPVDITGNWEGSLSGIQGDFPQPGGPSVVNLAIQQNGDVSGTILMTNRNETGTATGWMREGRIELTVDFPTSPDWIVNHRSKFTAKHNEIQGTVTVWSPEYQTKGRTMHGHGSVLDLDRQ